MNCQCFCLCILFTEWHVSSFCSVSLDMVINTSKFSVVLSPKDFCAIWYVLVFLKASVLVMYLVLDVWQGFHLDGLLCHICAFLVFFQFSAWHLLGLPAVEREKVMRDAPCY